MFQHSFQLANLFYVIDRLVEFVSNAGLWVGSLLSLQFV